MAAQYIKVLKALDIDICCVIGRGETKTNELASKYKGLRCISGGIDKYLKEYTAPTHAIVAVNSELLFEVSQALLLAGVQSILIEKPAALHKNEIEQLIDIKSKNSAFVAVGYNRRFYQSVEYAQSIIRKDNGISSCFFEFTEWTHIIKTDKYPADVLNRWVVANSCHVIDLAFYFCGYPKIINPVVGGEGLKWHPSGSIFLGSGISEKGIPFCYHSNWQSPGRWSIEILTANHRLYFKPMEKLRVQKNESLAIDEYEADYSLDESFKPGLYKQVRSFLQKERTDQLCSLEEQLGRLDVYQKMAGYDRA